LECAVIEKICLYDFLVASQTYAEWIKLYHKHPKHDEAMDSDEYESNGSNSQQTRTNTEAVLRIRTWKAQLDQLSSSLILSVTQILENRNGWLLGLTASNDDTTSKELEKLRSYCIPRLTISLHDVYAKLHRHNESLKLAVLIADERYQLYKAFDKKELRQLLALLTSSAKSLLEKVAREHRTKEIVA